MKRSPVTIIGTDWVFGNAENSGASTDDIRTSSQLVMARSLVRIADNLREQTSLLQRIERRLAKLAKLPPGPAGRGGDS